MRLLCVTPEYPPMFGGGIGSYYGSLLPALTAAGVHVTALVGSGVAEGPPAGNYGGVEVIPLDMHRVANLRSRLTQFSAAPDFVRHLAAAWAAWEQTDGGRGFDWVETTDWGLLFLPWVLSGPGRPRSSVTLHGSIGQISLHAPEEGQELSGVLARFAEAAFLGGADRLGSPGAANCTEWSQALSREVEHLYPPLAHGQPVPANRAGTNGVVAGRIQSWKGPEVLVGALGHVQNQSIRFTWYGRDTPAAAGGESTDQRLRKQFPQVWGRRVIPHGPIPPSTLRERFAAAAVVVIPSTWDVFNYACVEAMQVGAIVVCSRGAGAAELVDHDRNGFTFAPGEPLALANAIDVATGLSHDERTRMGAAARSTVQEKLAPGATAATYLTRLEHARTSSASCKAIGSRISLDFTPRSNADVTDHHAWLARLPIRVLSSHLLTRLRQKLGL